MIEFDFEKELQACKDKKRENETIVFTVGCGRMFPLITDRKKMRKGMEEALEYIKKLEGFVGVHPVDLWHTLLLLTQRIMQSVQETYLGQKMSSVQII